MCNALTQCFRQKPLRVVHRDLAAGAEGDEIEGVIGPRHIQEHRRSAFDQLAVQHQSESWFDDVIAIARDNQDWRMRLACARDG